MHTHRILLYLAETGKNAHGGDDALLGDEAGQGGCNRLPGAEAERCENPRDQSADVRQEAVLGINHTERAVLNAERAEEPHNRTADEQDSSCLLEECPDTLPHVQENGLDTGDVVLRQLHDKRSRISSKQLHLLEHDAGNNDGCDSGEVHHRSNPPCAADQETGDQRDNRQLCAARDKGRGNHGHPAILLVLNRAGTHDARYAAARGDQERDKGFAGQTEAAENPVHNEGDTHHVSAVLQNGEEQEYDCHLRGKSDRCCDTTNDTINNQRNQPIRRADTDQQALHTRLNPLAEQRVIRPVRDHGSQCGHRDVINQKHDCGENRQCKHTVGHNAVDFIRCAQTGRLLPDAFCNQLADIVISSVGDQGLRIVVQCGLRRRDDRLELVAVQIVLGENLLVALKCLDRKPAQAARRNRAADLLRDGIQRLLNRFCKLIGRLYRLAALRRRNRLTGQLLQILPLECRDFHHRTAQLGGQLFGVNPVSPLADDVHHIERNNDRKSHLDDLRGQIEISLDIGGVYDVDDRIRILLRDVFAGDYFFQCVRRE